jgi:hypothetical protein
MNTKSPFRLFCRLAVLLFIGLTPASLFAQGALIPPGSPAPTMKTLSQIEPRTPIAATGFVIAASGSYYLTTNLTAPAGHGITVQADDVSIDLNGFAMIGAGINSGILVSGTRTNLQVRNGTVRNWANGVNADSGVSCRFEQLRVERTTGSGIDGGTNAVVDHCQTFSCVYGIYVLGGSLVQDCKIEKSSVGIDVGDHTIISDCVIRGGNGIQANNSVLVKNCIVVQGALGISAGQFSKIINCIVTDNSQIGIQLAGGATVKDCTVNYNASTGISCFENCTISDCLVYGNGLGGITAQTGCKIKDCNVSQNFNGNGITVLSQSTVCDSIVQQNNGGKGILAGDVCVVARCNASLNERTQLEFGSYCQVLDNNLVLNTNNATSSFYDLYTTGNHSFIQGNNGTAVGGLGVVGGKTNVIVKNFSQLHITNTTNYYAPVIATFGAFTNGVNPWANFQP